MSSVMKFSVVNAVVLLLLIVLTGVFYMKKSKEIAGSIPAGDTIYHPPRNNPLTISELS